MLRRIIVAGQTLLEEFSTEQADVVITEFFMSVRIERQTKSTWLPGDWQVGCSALKRLSNFVPKPRIS